MVVDKFLSDYYAVTIGSLGYPIFQAGAVPEGQAYPYVLINAIQSIERLSPCLAYNCFVTIDIVTQHNAPLGKAQMYSIASDIDEIVNDKTQYSSDGWKIDNTYMSNSTDLEEQGNFGYIYRNLRVYQHQVSKTKLILS